MMSSSMVILKLNNYVVGGKNSYDQVFIIYSFTISSFVFFNSFLCSFLLLELLTFCCLTFLSLSLKNKRAFFVYVLISTLSSMAFIIAIVAGLSKADNLSQILIFLFISLKIGLLPVGL
jgi:hypothetical protein